MVTKDANKNREYHNKHTKKIRENSINTILSKYYEEIRFILKNQKLNSNDKLNKIYDITNNYAKDNS